MTMLCLAIWLCRATLIMGSGYVRKGGIDCAVDLGFASVGVVRRAQMDRSHLTFGYSDQMTASERDC